MLAPKYSLGQTHSKRQGAHRAKQPRVLADP
jgi:hypothetical protein